MKYALILGDGMGDYPVPALGGRTPLEVADKPCMDMLAKTGRVGLVKTVPDGYKPGSDVANLGALGYDASACYTGRSPLEALSIGIDMKEDDVAVRMNLVTLSDEEDFAEKTMKDYSAGEITTPEARELVEYLGRELGSDRFAFYPGVSYRHCLIIAHGSTDMQLTPPHDISGKKIGDYLPKGDLSAELTELVRRSNELLSNHPINKKRVLSGQNPANSVWFWGQGTRPALENFEKRYGLKGGMVSAVDLLKGIAIGAGMKSVDVEGATGTLSTNFAGKAKAACDLLDGGCDFVFVHLEAPDECGHQGDVEGKVRAIECVDKKNTAADIRPPESGRRRVRAHGHARPLHPRVHSHAFARAGAFPDVFLLAHARRRQTVQREVGGGERSLLRQTVGTRPRVLLPRTLTRRELRNGARTA